MIEFNFSSNILALKNDLSMLRHKHIPGAVAETLTALAKRVVIDEKANEAAVIDRVRPFTQGAIGYVKATSKSLRAKIYMKDITARYMDPYEFGGLNKLNGPDLLKPIGARSALNQYGNLPRKYVAAMLARTDVFAGIVKTKKGPVNGIWQRTTEPGEKVGIRRNKQGVWYMGKTGSKRNTTQKLKLLVELTDAHPIAEKNRLHWFERAGKIINGNFDATLGKTLARALSTAGK